MIGTTPNQYRITARLGAGGRGEVFRARDMRLRRDVAVKMSPKGFTNGAGRLRHFARVAVSTMVRALGWCGWMA